MKNISLIIAGLSLLLFCKAGVGNEKSDNQSTIKPEIINGDCIHIMYSEDLQNLTAYWVDEYCKLNPKVKISITNSIDQQVSTENTIYLATDENFEKTGNEATWKIVIGREIIVPVINSKNPMIDEIYRQGISSDEFALFFSDPSKQRWNYLINGGQNVPVQYYLIDNESVKNSISNFVNTNPGFTDGILVKTGNDLISVLEKDVYAIGFCKLTDIINTNTMEIASNVKLVPIDKNLNGRLDNFEHIYDNLNTFTRGIWIGKYPMQFNENIYALASAKPTDKDALAFLTWLTTDGQKNMNSYGFCHLGSIEKELNLLALTNQGVSMNQNNETEYAGLWMLIVIAFIITGFIVTALVKSFNRKQGTHFEENIKIKPLLDENSIIAPKGIYFDKTHTWAFMEKDGLVRVGIDDFLLHITGVLTKVKMNSPGEKIRRGEKILSINHNGKQLDLYSPVSGIIKEQNQAIIKDSSKINSSPYSDGWVYSIEPTNWLREVQFMFMAEKYKEWLRNEFTRLKDFFAASVRSNNAVYAHIILQDGGELTDNVLADLGPEVWEEFQTNFINTSK